MGPNPIMTGLPIKRGSLDTEMGMHTCRMSRKDEGRIHCDAFTSQGMPEIASKPPEARREARNSLLFSPQKGPALPIP